MDADLRLTACAHSHHLVHYERLRTDLRGRSEGLLVVFVDFLPQLDPQSLLLLLVVMERCVYGFAYSTRVAKFPSECWLRFQLLRVILYLARF